MCDDGNSVFQAKKKYLCSKIWGLMRSRGQNFKSKMSYLESPTLICLFNVQLLWATIMIKGSLLLSAPIVKHFRSKKLKKVPFGPKFDGFGGWIGV